MIDKNIYKKFKIFKFLKRPRDPIKYRMKWPFKQIKLP